MTDAWAAKVLEGVPRIHPWHNEDAYIKEADALAAIARMGAGDGLVERISEPHDPGDFVGDIFYGHPIKTTMGTHRWTGTEWVALPSEAEALAGLLAEARKEAAALRERVARLEGLLQEARTDLQSYVDHDYPPETCAAHPSVARQHFRDMELCRRIDAALNDGGSNG